MADTRFTEGPFIIEPINDGHTYQITTPDPDFRVVSETAVHADALLQAAAPELYEAGDPIEDVLNIEDTNDLPDETPVTVIIGERVHDFTLKLSDLRRFQQARAKARGEAV